MKPVLVLTAVPEEAAPLEAMLQGKTRLSVSGIPLIRGLMGKREIHMLISGPGVLNTAARLAAVLSGFRPEWILQVGCGGMYPQSGLVMGGIALASQERDLHIGLESQTLLPRPLPFPLLEHPETVPGLYPADPHLTRIALSLFQEKFSRRVLCGPFVTVSTITATETTARVIEEETGGLLENMEGAAAFHTAALYDVPILEIRSVSNPVGSRNRKDWDLETAFIRAAEGAKILLEEIR